MKNTSILLAVALMLLPACTNNVSESDETSGKLGELQNELENNDPESDILNNESPTDVVKEGENTKNNNIAKENVEEETPAVTNSNSGISGLIPSTNPKERLGQISKGKSDPFNSITPPSNLKVTSNNPFSSNRSVNGNSRGNPQIAATNRNLNNPTQTSRNNKEIKVLQPFDPNNPNPNTANTPNGINNQSIAKLEPPKPLEAEKVNVSGIVDIQGQNVALVQTPWDGTTRSVRVGDIISNDTGSINIQVKAISFGFPTNAAFPDVNQVTFSNINDGEGMVLLEQEGRTFTREVSQTTLVEEKL